MHQKEIEENHVSNCKEAMRSYSNQAFQLKLVSKPEFNRNRQFTTTSL